MNAETQIAYALNQYQLCCEHLNIPQRYDVDGDTLLEAVVALIKDRDELSDESAHYTPSSTPETDAAWGAHQADSTCDEGDPWGLAAKLERDLSAALRTAKKAIAYQKVLENENARLVSLLNYENTRRARHP